MRAYKGHRAPEESHCCRAFPDPAMSFPGLTLPERIPQNDTFLLTVMTIWLLHTRSPIVLLIGKYQMKKPMKVKHSLK